MEPQDAKSARMKRKHALLHRGSDKKRLDKGTIHYLLHIIN